MWLIGLQVNLFAIIFMHLDFLIFCWFETCIESFSYLHLVQTLAHYSMIHGSKDKQIVLFLCMSFLSSLNKSFLSLGTRYSRCKMMFFWLHLILSQIYEMHYVCRIWQPEFHLWFTWINPWVPMWNVKNSSIPVNAIANK